MRRIYLNKLNLQKVHVEIDLDFLDSVIKKSKSFCNDEKKLCKKIGLKINSRLNKSLTIVQWLKGKRSVSLDKLIKLSKLSKIDWKDFESKIISLKAGANKNGRIFPKLPFELNFEMGRIIGHILGDGAIDKKYNQVFFSNSNIGLLNEFKQDMCFIFGVEPRIWMQKRADYGNTKWEKRLKNLNEKLDKRNIGLFYPSICGRILNSIFSGFAKGYEKKLTPRILRSNKRFRRGVIRSFYDDEGSVGKKSIRLFQDRKEILEDFRQMLISFKIYPSELKSYVKRGKERYYFDIFKKSNFKRFQKEIGFTSSIKSQRLKNLCLIKNVKNSR